VFCVDHNTLLHHHQAINDLHVLHGLEGVFSGRANGGYARVARAALITAKVWSGRLFSP
jgi:hypothetical protein